MRLIDRPKFGPLFRFSDYHVYKTLSLLSDGRRKGRKALADRIGVGEGSMRTIVEYLRDEGYVDISQTGIKISRKGQDFLSRIPLVIYRLDASDMVPAGPAEAVAVLVKGMAYKIKSGMEQRDQAIKAGADGATTVIVKDGHLTVPVDFDLDKERPESARAIRDQFDLNDGDVVIVGIASDLNKAEEGALTAAFEIL